MHAGAGSVPRCLQAARRSCRLWPRRHTWNTTRAVPAPQVGIIHELAEAMSGCSTAFVAVAVAGIGLTLAAGTGMEMDDAPEVSGRRARAQQRARGPAANACAGRTAPCSVCGSRLLRAGSAARRAAAALPGAVQRRDGGRPRVLGGQPAGRVPAGVWRRRVPAGGGDGAHGAAAGIHLPGAQRCGTLFASRRARLAAAAARLPAGMACARRRRRPP